MKPKTLQILAWGSSLVVSVTAFVAWGEGVDWQLTNLGFYRLFPLFGLLGFSLMWSHYISAVLRLYFKIEREVLKTYFEVTSLAVLAAILLHPGLLWWQLWRDGIGLPPTSSYKYVNPSMKLYIVIALISLTIFLTYELRRKFGTKSWWKYVGYASDTAMLLIVLHSFKIGTNLQSGWFRAVWYFYAVTLLGCLGYIYYLKFQPTPLPPTKK